MDRVSIIEMKDARDNVALPSTLLLGKATRTLIKADFDLFISAFIRVYPCSKFFREGLCLLLRN
jgi:hypothetical protein